MLYSLGFNIGKETTKTNSTNVKLISGIRVREQIVTLRHIKHWDHEVACVFNKDEKEYNKNEATCP